MVAVGGSEGYSAFQTLLSLPNVFKTRHLCFDSEFCILGGSVSFPSS